MVKHKVEEVPPDMDHKTGPSVTTTTGNFIAKKIGGVMKDVWSWPNGWPTGTWYIGGSTTNPISDTNPLITSAQQFTGSASSISPSGSGTSYQIWYQSTRVGHVYVNTTGSTAQWWMYQTSYTTSGPYLPTPTDTAPLELIPGTAVSGTGWKGTNI